MEDEKLLPPGEEPTLPPLEPKPVVSRMPEPAPAPVAPPPAMPAMPPERPVEPAKEPVQPLPGIPSAKQQSWGVVISIVIIVMMIVVGAFYAWGKRISQNQNPPAGITQ